MTLPGNRTVGYTYNVAGRRASMTDWLGGVESFSYDADGNLTGVNRPNNVNTVYSYDAGGRLTGVTHNGPNGALLQYTYTLDENSNRIKVVSPAGTENYTLDALSRLTNVTYGNGDTASYAYDANGNRTSQTVNGATTNYNYDDAGELLSDGATNYSYDANGNLTAAGADSYTWDWANRLTGATVGGNSAAYTYDAADLRVGATVNGATSNYLWDRQADIPQLLDDGSHAYLYGDGPLAQVDAGGNRQYLLTDALNSVRGLADNGGNLAGTADYGVFGGLRGQTGAASALGFTGGLFTATTGLLHLNARDLALNLGRFLSVDTEQPNAPGTQGYNLYAYVANNPTTWIDPSGHNVGTMPMPQPLLDPQQIKDLLLLGASGFVRLLGGLVAFPWTWAEVIGVIFLLVVAILIAVLVIYLVQLLLEFKLKQPLDSPLSGPLPPDKVGQNPDEDYPNKPDIPEPERPTDPKTQDQICENPLDCPIPPKDQIPDDDPACAPDVTYLMGRATEIREVIKSRYPIAYNHQTVAVLRAKRKEGGCTDIAGGQQDLLPMQRLTLKAYPVEEAAKRRPTEDAEVTVYKHYEETMFFEHPKPIALGIAGPLPICATCRSYLQGKNAVILSDRAAIWR